MADRTAGTMGIDAQAGPPFLDAERLRLTLSIPEAIEALDRAFSGELPTTPLRSHYAAEGGELLLMPAWGPIGVGVKLVTLDEGNAARGMPFIHGLFVLFGPEGKEPVATLDGAALTAIRTAAVSALSTRYLAREDARTLVIFGAGRQAYSHLEAMLAVRKFHAVVVVDPAPDKAQLLVAHAAGLGLEGRVGVPEDVAEADVVCCCTTSRQPVVRGDLLAPGTHIVAMGAYRPDMCEVDVATLRRSRVIVEDRETVLLEAGDFLLPMGRGEWTPDGIHGELAEAVRGPARRTDPDEITLCKTVGMASEDLVVAHAAVAKLHTTT
ncbi:MAG: ornithine cyclodeaminase [Conexibacter sp.]|nr:ornithine cyclodeaminase [Conexibacter sp.]